MTIYRDGKKYIDSIMAYRMGYSLDTVRDTPYVPSEYGDLEWSKSGDSGDVYFTGNPETHMVQHYVGEGWHGLFSILLRTGERG